MYGVPNIKLPKEILLAKIKGLEEAAFNFAYTNVGIDYQWSAIREQFAAVVICTGSTEPRALKLPGNELKGIYLCQRFFDSGHQKPSRSRTCSGNID
jgi:glutamate synthase (NADPH/NADH) small chain